MRPARKEEQVHIWRRVAMAILITVLVLATAVPALATHRVRVYRGETSQEHRIKFYVMRSDTGPVIVEMVIRLTYTCDDGTTRLFEVGFGGFNVPIVEESFSFEQVGMADAFRIDGRLGRFSGEGTYSYLFPALTADERPQLCTTGALTWTVGFVRTRTLPY